MEDGLIEIPPEVNHHHANSSPCIKRGGQHICTPQDQRSKLGQAKVGGRTIILGPEGETSPSYQVLEGKSNHCPRDIVQRRRGWDENNTTEQDPE